MRTLRGQSRTAGVLFGLGLLLSAAVAGPPDTLWTRTFGTANSDGAYAVAVARDSGYFVAGFQNGSTASRRWYMHTDRDGNKLWENLASSYSYARGVYPADDGGCFACGWYREVYPDTSIDVWVHRRSAAGGSGWSSVFRYGNRSWDERANSVVETFGGGCAVVASPVVTGGHIWLLRLSSSGSRLWDRSYTAHWYWTVPYWVGQTPDSGFAIIGHSSAGSQSDFFLLRTGAAGETLWVRTWGGTQEDRAWAGAMTEDHGFVLCGYTRSFGAGGEDAWLVRTDSAGDTLWSRTYGSAGNQCGTGIGVMPDRGFIICGYDGSNPWLVRTDSLGDTLWTRTLSGGGYFYGVQPTPEGDIIVAGQKNSDAWLVKFAGQSGLAEDPHRLPVAPRPASFVRAMLHLSGSRPAHLLDAAGRRLADLAPGENDVRSLPMGVYFSVPAGRGPVRRLVIVE